MSVGSVPIYWGTDYVKKDFNPKCFINYSDYDSQEEFLEDLVSIDKNESKYEHFLSQPIFKDNKIPDFIKPHSLLNFFEENILC